jgi:hypothetical protein
MPLIFLYGREVENLPDPREKCRELCQTAEDYHNREILTGMRKFNSFVEKPPLVCVEEKISLLQRHKLKELTKNKLTKNRVQYFNQFIERFSECGVDIDEVYEQIFKEKS